MPENLESTVPELRLGINIEDTATRVTKRETESLKARTVVVMPAGGK